MEKQSMTTEAINDFARALQTDEKMAHELAGAISQNQGGDAAVELQKPANDAEGVLSDDKLDGVAGGGRVAQSYGTDMWRRPSHVPATFFNFNDGRYQTF